MAHALYMLLLFFFVTQISQMTQIFLRGIIFVPQIYTDIHRFFSSEGFSSDFTDESEGILAYRITHGFSRIFGRWPMARARYVLLLFFVTQISQMTQIFLRGIILSHRFHRFTQIFFIGILFIGRHGISRMRPVRSLQIPPETDKEIHQRFHKKSVYICEICGTKPSHEEKSASSAKSA